MKLIAGVDEAGRGPLAGPVVAAAVILPKNYSFNELADSKSLSEKQRKELYLLIKEKALSWNIAFISSKKIDSINILQATLLAMKKAVEGLEIKPDKVVIDGISRPDLHVPSTTIIKGDTKHKSIMAASIIAKVTRDEFMKKLDKKFPQYGFLKHKGYPTKLHFNALELYGPCEQHRASFRPLKDK